MAMMMNPRRAGWLAGPPLVTDSVGRAAVRGLVLGRGALGFGDGLQGLADLASAGVRPGHVPEREDADELLPFHHRKAPDPVPLHELAGLREAHVRRHRQPRTRGAVPDP